MLIGEVAELSGVSARMLRHYDSLGLVTPSERTSGGYRSYSAADLDRLFHVEGLRSLGLSLADIAAALDTPGFEPAAMVDRLMADTRERIARDRELLGRLDRVRAGEPSTWADVLRTIALMRGLAAAEPSTRQRVALTAGAQRGDLATLAEAMLVEPQVNVADTLIWALARSGDDAVPLLAAALTAPDADRRRRAVHALRKFNTPAALNALATQTANPDPAVAARAVLARGSLGDADAIPALVALIREGRDDVEAADTLATLAAPDTEQPDPTGNRPASPGRADAVARAIAAALEAAEGPEAADARRRLASALADIPGPQAAGLLRRLTTDPDPGVAAIAHFLLARTS
ncbi:MerR family transcriptional regulator [Millisia brevis]|uniref:MerR family transcriptional regulator n=1 Tax=Millisia brevis TaxID=264148 RepID=UPI0008368345|nr:MerR family transcriptional regulator [Millisia brevis]